MSNPTKIRWGRIVLATIMSEVGVIAVLAIAIAAYTQFGPQMSAAEENALGEEIGYYVAPTAGFVATVLAVLWAARPLVARFIAHGMLIGLGSVLSTVRPTVRKEWRRGRDSNPGPGSTPGNRLAGGCHRPTRPPLRAQRSIFPAGPSFVNSAGGSGTEWRRGRDSNPRGLPIPVFKTAAFNRSATPPRSYDRTLGAASAFTADAGQ